MIKVNGGTGVLFVSHRLDEVLELADRVTVLRDGAVVWTGPVDGLTHESLVEHIVGRAVETYHAKPTDLAGRTVLRASGLSGVVLKDVSFDVAAGEVLGVTGILGSGREELASLVFGGTPCDGGEIRVDDKLVSPLNPSSARQAGMALVPQNRATYGLVASMSVGENLSLAHLGPLSSRLGIRQPQERALVNRWIRDLGVVPADPDANVTRLSGGNQQKVVLGKWLATKPRVMVLDEPVQGVDVGAKAEIFRLLAEAAAGGVALLLCSGDAEELASVCDRVLILADGRIVEQLWGDA